MIRNDDRFSGHESFVCRYGWLPKVHRAVQGDPHILRKEDDAMHTLGIGRNMVKSIQFWGEAMGVIESDDAGGHRAGPIGAQLFGNLGWDPHLESLEALWLLHWWITTRASLAAWSVVFGEGHLHRFDRKSLVEALAKRGQGASRALVATTLEQHAGIFLQSYYQEQRGIDDTSWCPLQDLSLLRVIRDADTRVAYISEARPAIGLTPRVFAMALVQAFEGQQVGQRQVVEFDDLLRGPYSPGIVFRLDEAQLRQSIEAVLDGPLKNALKFNDTADTQTLVINLRKVDPCLRLNAHREALADA